MDKADNNLDQHEHGCNCSKHAADPLLDRKTVWSAITLIVILVLLILTLLHNIH